MLSLPQASESNIEDLTACTSKVQMRSQAKVAILLATYQGQQYLAEQMNSFASQTHTTWEVWASDDGSTDGTRAVLEAYQRLWSFARLLIFNGPQKGFAANFMSLACHPEISADYYAFADQDDIWEKDKLAQALKWFESVPDHIPALYCSRTRLVDQHNNDIGLSPLFTKKPSFANALVQSIGGANTMLFNNAARKLIQKATNGKNTKEKIVSHDWWTYLVVSGAGGQVYFDPIPTVRYRQHQKNIVGTSATLKGKLKRIRMMWDGDFSIHNEINLHALKAIDGLLTPENRERLNHLKEAREARLVSRLLRLRKVGIYRQTLLGNLGLAVAALFRKL